MLHSKGKILPKITINEFEFKEKFATALRQEMHAQYWTGKMVANALDVSERTVKDWMAGKRIPNGIDLLALMRISSCVRQLVWDISKSEDCYQDTEMLRQMCLTLLSIKHR
ncbi:TPA: helix-turn-helix domain-containing protein [Pasteurella multocida]|nr:helix-turn-helix domain-containing protein [Pasteurella multocida]